MINNDYKFVFCTGAPGSAWSRISYRLKKFHPLFDTSDESENKKYYMPEHHINSQNYDIKDSTWTGVAHIGSYFGPYHDHGHGFDNIPLNYSVDEFYSECLKAFQNDDPEKTHKLIRSHWFAYNLDWIWNNCKGNYLFLIWREPEESLKWWYSMGGWEITYPIYKWYENDETMKKRVYQESNNIRDFAKRHDIEFFKHHDGWIKEKWGDIINDRTFKANPNFSDEIKIAFVEIK